MKKEDIKRHLTIYSIFDKRSTTINHAFASAIAPSVNYDEKIINEALEFLGQNPNEDLKCIFCEKEAETWDHLTGLVKNKVLRGFGHQIGNLVPCCKECNSKKGSKEFEQFINETGQNNSDLINRLQQYQNKFAKIIDLEYLKQINPIEFEEYYQIKKEIFELMKKADKIAEKLRKQVIK